MELPSVQREVAGVEMYFREEPSLSSAPVFNVYLGDAFYMYIRYTGSYHVIKPVECTAYAGVVIDKNVTSMVLWDRNKCSAVDGILEDFRYETNALLSATLYGFQFHQSPYVTIECTVSICNPHSQCAKQTELCHSTKRRRMMAQNPSSLGKGSFRVISAARNTGRPNETSSFLSCCSLRSRTPLILTSCQRIGSGGNKMASYIDYEDPAWTYVYVPAYSYDDEPLGFFINPRENMYSGVRSYDDSTFDIRRRRYILEDQLLGDDWDYIPLPRRHASPVRRRSRSVSREYVPVSYQENRSRLPSPAPVASVPTFRRSPSAGKYARQLRFDSRTSWVPFPSPKEDEFSVNLDLKTDALNRVLLRRDIDTALRSSYANKGRSVIVTLNVMNLKATVTNDYHSLSLQNMYLLPQLQNGCATAVAVHIHALAFRSF
uniref:ZP domain-containing protein n=1 Tax=Magallana gigas TaxID=29159 RepID=A0A8W8LD70_MAGGI